MRRKMLLALVLALIASACGGDDESEAPAATPAPVATAVAPTAAPAVTTAPTLAPLATAAPTPAPVETTVPPTPAPTTTVVPTTTSPPAPTETEVPIQFDRYLILRTWAVVLVDADGALNVRVGPGVENPKLTSFSPTQRGILLTGQYAQVDGDKWVEVETEDARGWVSSFFLTEEWSIIEFQNDWDIDTVRGRVADLAAAMAVAGDLSDPVSDRGLFVVYFDTNEIIVGPNAPFPVAKPTQFQNFRFVALFDPGDDPVLDGLDWQTWFVYFDYEGGHVRIVGLSPLAAAP